MSFAAPSRLLLVGLVAVVSTIVGFDAGTASACSCVTSDPVVAIGNADVVFTGTLVDKTAVGPDNGYHFDWTFEVDGVVKGDVASPQFVTGQEFGGGCGVNFVDIAGSVTVYARRDGDDLASIGCSATPAAAELQVALDQAAAESITVGSGPAAALAVGRAADANLFVLGTDGLPLARAQLAVEPWAVAHCDGSTLAAVWSYGPSVDQEDGSSIAGVFNVISIVDLESMEIIETREIESEFMSLSDELECFDGGRRVMLTRGEGTDGQQVTVATSVADGENVSRLFDDVTRAVIHPSQTVALLPTQHGDPIRMASGAGELGPVGPPTGAQLGDDVAVVAGAFSPDGSQMAVLVTSSGDEVAYDTDATGLFMLDVVDGLVQPATGDPIALPPHDGRARQVAWLNNDHLVIEHETDNSKLFDVITTDGDAVASSDVGWGWGLTRLNGSLLRSRAGGLELITADLTSVPLVPSPGEQFEDGFFSTAAVIGAPDMELPQLAGSALTIRPYEQTPTTDSEPTSDEPPISDEPPVEDSPTGDEPDLSVVDEVPDGTARPAPSKSPDDSGLQFAGLAFLAFLAVGGFLLVRRRSTERGETP